MARLAVVKLSSVTDNFLSPGLKYFTRLSTYKNLGSQFFHAYYDSNTKQEINSLRSVCFDTHNDKQGLSLPIIYTLRHEMLVLQYTKHMNKYCGCISTIITEERGLLYNQLCRRQFISSKSKVQV
jgi:hypothetical protein